ncbi:hypothetical protein B0H14DRAFT_2562522 [Mycena olivaceomarginata]|nr:hypothetical protein B0H14DRAFT_2562522 [Mycena olivaceomarginata]
MKAVAAQMLVVLNARPAVMPITPTHKLRQHLEAWLKDLSWLLALHPWYALSYGGREVAVIVVDMAAVKQDESDERVIDLAVDKGIGGHMGVALLQQSDAVS